MKLLYSTIIFLFLMFAACESYLTRQKDESVESFAKRYGPPQTSLTHKVIETIRWGGESEAIIAFYEQEFEKSCQVYRRI